MQITAELQNAAVFERVLSKVAAADLAPLMLAIGHKIETSVLQNYNQQRSPQGVPWIPSRRAKKDGGKTLIDTGKMLASLTVIVGAEQVEIGYPAMGGKHIPQWLQEGSGAYPERAHLGLRPEDEAMIEIEAKHYFERLLA